VKLEKFNKCSVASSTGRRAVIHKTCEAAVLFSPCLPHCVRYSEGSLPREYADTGQLGSFVWKPQKSSRRRGGVPPTPPPCSQILEMANFGPQIFFSGLRADSWKKYLVWFPLAQTNLKRLTGNTKRFLGKTIG